MLKAVEKGDKDFVEFCRRDVFGTRISCLYNCYSTDYDFVKFWKQTDDDGNIISAIGRIDGDATLTSTGENPEEIHAFLRIVGFCTVQCEKRIAELMGAKSSLEGYVVEYIKNKNEIKEIQADNVFRPKEIYDIIKLITLKKLERNNSSFLHAQPKISRISVKLSIVQSGVSAGFVMWFKWLNPCRIQMVCIPSCLAGRISLSKRSPIITACSAKQFACWKANSKIAKSGFAKPTSAEEITRSIQESIPNLLNLACKFGNWLAIIPIL